MTSRFPAKKSGMGKEKSGWEEMRQKRGESTKKEPKSLAAAAEFDARECL